MLLHLASLSPLAFDSLRCQRRSHVNTNAHPEGEHRWPTNLSNDATNPIRARKVVMTYRLMDADLLASL